MSALGGVLERAQLVDSMCARAIVALVDGVPDDEALRFVRGLAAAGRPHAQLDEMARKRDADRAEALRRPQIPFDAHPEQTAMKREKYARMRDEGLLPADWRRV